jgi:ribosome maturation factor RimP
MGIEEMREVIDACASRASAHLIDLTLRGSRGRTIVEVFIDAEKGVTSGLCAEVSREIAGVIDAKGWIQGAYHLEVSSPGIDRPLKYPWQYPKHVGRAMIVTVKGPEGPVQKTGKLASVLGADIVIDPDKGHPAETISFESIVEAFVKPPW